MKTTCICCGKRALHERVRSLGGTWYRCNVCNFAWRGAKAYAVSLIANVWWPIKGPAHVVPAPESAELPRTEPGRPDRVA